MDIVFSQFRTFPLPTLLALTFYLALVGCAVNASFRLWLKTRLVMPTPSSQAYVAAVDTIRGLAALFVALFHTWQWTRPTFDVTERVLPPIANGDLAVPIFVVVSAFLITRALFGVENLAALKGYFVRRLLRIYPLYLVVVLATILTGLFPIGVESFLPRLLAEVFMLRIFGFQSFVNPVAWSLYVEAAFYVAAPAVMLLFGRYIASMLVALLVILYSTEIYAVVQFAREYALWRYFLFGMLAAVVIEQLRGQEGSRIDYLLLAAGVLIVLIEAGLRIDIVHVFIGAPLSLTRHQFPFALGLGIGLMIVALGRLPRLSEAVSPTPLRMLGCVSYSLFLWHPIVICLSAPVQFNGAGGIVAVGQLSLDVSQWALPFIFAPAFIAIAALSFLAVERPFLLLRRRLDPSLAGVASAKV
jgi:peptidoglycan/LPS O-acetylase OafA/YrhL